MFSEYNFAYFGVHFTTGILVVTLVSNATIAIVYAIVDALLHTFVVHTAAHKLAHRLAYGKTMVETVTFGILHMLAAFLLAFAVSRGDFETARNIGLAEPTAQVIMKYFYTRAYKQIRGT